MADALDLLAGEHREVGRLFSEIGETTKPEQRRTIVNQIVRALSLHASIEEEIFYPTVKDRVVEGDGYITVSLEEHEKAKIQLKKLDKLKPDDPLFSPSVGELIKEVRVHISDEELQLFPRVRAAFSQQELDELGERMAARKAVAPTRPHPKAASKPPLNVVGNRAAAAVDRARDAGREGV